MVNGSYGVEAAIDGLGDQTMLGRNNTPPGEVRILVALLEQTSAHPGNATVSMSGKQAEDSGFEPTPGDA